ncbi:MAG: TIGR00282 family metallophosphoesterase [Patescibacteria group bacterium]
MPDNPLIKVLFFGDIVGKPGRRALVQAVPNLKKKYAPNYTIANAENIAHGIGITKKTLSECASAGIDLFTSGNHTWAKPEAESILGDENANLIRPANELEAKSGTGYRIVDAGIGKLLVINLIGRVFMEGKYASPFTAVDSILDAVDADQLAGTIVDFHAEATSEKNAFGWHVDGRVSAVLGTHTHIQTADERILPNGTAYISDIGMVGLRDSVIGIDKDVIVNNFLEKRRLPHDIPEHGVCTVGAVQLEIDPHTQKAVRITRISTEVTV